MHYEAGQILHANPVMFECPDFAAALLTAIRSEISRVYWNVHQKPFYDAGGSDIGSSYDHWSDRDKFGKPPLGIPGMDWNPYYNWGGSPEDEDWDQESADAPNFAFEGVEFRWYKYFGRSLNVSVVWPAEKWCRWFERAMQTLRAFETNRDNCPGDPSPYPDPDGRVSLTVDTEDLRHIRLMEKVATLEAQMNMMACVCLSVERGEQPDVRPDDWRYCHDLEWIVQLGKHALTAPIPFKLRDDEDTVTLQDEVGLVP